MQTKTITNAKFFFDFFFSWVVCIPLERKKCLHKKQLFLWVSRTVMLTSTKKIDFTKTICFPFCHFFATLKKEKKKTVRKKCLSFQASTFKWNLNINFNTYCLKNQFFEINGYLKIIPYISNEWKSWWPCNLPVVNSIDTNKCLTCLI